MFKNCSLPNQNVRETEKHLHDRHLSSTYVREYTQ